LDVQCFSSLVKVSGLLQSILKPRLLHLSVARATSQC
jgi:hypothetical protein